MREWGQGWSSALFYYGDDALNRYRFERVDLRGQAHSLGRANVELAGMLQQRLDNQPTTWADNNYDHRQVLYFNSVRVLMGAQSRMTLLSLPRRWQRGLLLLCLLLSVPAWSADILLTAAEDGARVQAFVQALTQQRPTTV